MSPLKQSLHQSIDRWNLLEHPFYRAWADGTLPVAKLQRYAGEYAGFINTVAGNWRSAGEPKIAAEEEQHYAMWQQFAGSLGAVDLSPKLQATKELVAVSGTSTADRATALGSLYAFEAQQPYTAASKLEGLQDHYAAIGADQTYFKVHVNDDQEPALLLEHMEQLSSGDRARAVDACEKTAHALWDTLTAIDEAG